MRKPFCKGSAQCAKSRVAILLHGLGATFASLDSPAAARLGQKSVSIQTLLCRVHPAMAR